MYHLSNTYTSFGDIFLKKMKQYLWSYNIIVDIHFKFVCWKKHTKISELSNTYFVIIKIHVFNWYPWAPQMVCNVLQLSAHSCFRLTYDGDVFWNGCAGERYIPCVKCNHFHYMIVETFSQSVHPCTL